MKRLQVLANNILAFLLKYIRFAPILILAVLILVLFLTNSNYYHGKLFYTNTKTEKLFYEQRPILKGKNKLDKLNKIVDEVLLGPSSENYINMFPQKAKLISSWLEGDIYCLNLSKETITDIDIRNNTITPHYNLALQSILFSLYLNEKGIKGVKFYFDGHEYRYIDNINLSNNTLRLNWKFLAK